MPTHSADARARARTRARAQGRPRTRLLAATAFLLTACTALTGCYDGQGLRDEGPSSVSRSAGRPCPARTDTARAAPDTVRRVQRSFCATSTAQ
ncbi:hypothetical protein [Streptomyces mexicanus]|jgi:hypothetical protein|uniref:hypothetical protein n=1 Tax=Streptomyces mexicanus TaxID=178566 RepID=UPI0036C057EB